MMKVIIFNSHMPPEAGGMTIKTVAYTDYQILEKQIRELKKELKIIKDKKWFIEDLINRIHWETHGNFAWGSGEVTNEQKKLLND